MLQINFDISSLNPARILKVFAYQCSAAEINVVIIVYLLYISTNFLSI